MVQLQALSRGFLSRLGPSGAVLPRARATVKIREWAASCIRHRRAGERCRLLWNAAANEPRRRCALAWEELLTSIYGNNFLITLDSTPTGALWRGRSFSRRSGSMWERWRCWMISTPCYHIWTYNPRFYSSRCWMTSTSVVVALGAEGEAPLVLAGALSCARRVSLSLVSWSAFEPCMIDSCIASRRG